MEFSTNTVTARNMSGKKIVLGFLAFIGLILLIMAIDIVQTGNTQVVSRFGRVVRTNGEGLAFHIPFIERTKSIDTTIQRESASAVVATSNLQQVTTNVAVNYRITKDNAVKQYQNFTKKDFVEIIVKPKIQDSIKAVTPKYTAETLVLQRPQVAVDIKTLLTNALQEYGIDVVDVSIENYSFGADYTQAVANKSVIVQQIEAAKLNTEKIELEGNNRIAQANKDSEVRRVEAQQDEKNLRFFELQIQDKAVTKWNGVSPLYTGSSSVLTVPIK